MSIANIQVNGRSSNHAKAAHDVPKSELCPDLLQQMHVVIERVLSRVAPVWPLKDYVAVNPYMGFTGQKFLEARQNLRKVSDFEILMPVDYYREQYAQGVFTKAHLNAAVDEMVADDMPGAERLDVNRIVALLRAVDSQDAVELPVSSETTNPSRVLHALAETIDRYQGTEWSEAIREEISKLCAGHFDEGQAAWANPWRGHPLYEAWRERAEHDRTFEVLGIRNFRKTVGALPNDPFEALATMMNHLNLPERLWEDFLLCAAYATPGWSAWISYQQRQANVRDESNSDFAGLLAMRLAHEVALADHLNFKVNWPTVADHHQSIARHAVKPAEDDLMRFAMLKACEMAFRQGLISKMADNARLSVSHSKPKRSLAQMVFCIDVRSERMRRHIESTCDEIETFGFAGFFGLPIEFVSIGEESGSDQVPVLISPQFKVREASDNLEADIAIANERGVIRFLRKAWKEFQTTAAGAFSFVETTGLWFAPKLLKRTLGWPQANADRFDGVAKCDHHRLGPSLAGLCEQDVSNAAQINMAESVLRGIGIVDNFARLVILCGHGSQTENNPLQAGLDCGACGGHTGEANARFAAKLLNQAFIRVGLMERGIEIPDDTHFLAALHNTTTDLLTYFDTEDLPASHRTDYASLVSYSERAGQQTRGERLPSLPGAGEHDLIRRSQDWSEVRPEWGLAGNACFIAAPRKLTESLSLEGRSFLHSYDHRKDSGFAVLETIMTAPLVVANWINMQYYASTVDPHHFGSGNKTVHNVAGRFGVLSGNSGDLMTGLPWQSLHDGENYLHEPLRLLAVIAAPRDAIEQIVARHQLVSDLLSNGWVQLIAVDDGVYYRYTEQRSWDALSVKAKEPLTAGV